MLKGRRCIREPERHNRILVETVARAERCLLFIALRDRDTVIGVLNIDLRKVLGALNAVEDFSNQGERVLVLRRDFVQSSVVDIESQSAILLRDKEDRGRS